MVDWTVSARDNGILSRPGTGTGDLQLSTITVNHKVNKDLLGSERSHTLSEMTEKPNDRSSTTSNLEE